MFIHLKSVGHALALLGSVSAVALLSVAPAHAADAPASGAPASDVPASDVPAGFWASAQLTGDWGGARTRLGDLGVELDAVATNDLIGDVSGGARRGFIMDGNVLATMKLDLDKAVGWTGGSAKVSAYGIYGNELSAHYVHNLDTVTDVEAEPGAKLYEAWVEQVLADGKISIRVGQQGADQEFAVSTYAALFINSTFGVPALFATDLPGGGPAYPLATPAVRVKFQPTGEITVLAAIFNGSPSGYDRTDPQAADAGGTQFRIGDGPLYFWEAQYARNQGADDTGLPGTFRLGGWYQPHGFADLATASNGVSLASPSSSLVPARHSDNYAFYAIADQMLLPVPGSKDGGLAAFARIAGAPGDRNLMSFYVDAGLNGKGLLPGRADDNVGLAVAYGRVGSLRALAEATPGMVVPDHETAIEATYSYQAAGWWVLQPDLQYIIQPGARLNGTKLNDALVLGMRSGITF